MRAALHRDMPRRRGGHTTAVTIGGERFTVTANEAADGSLGEVFIRHGKQGTAGAGLLDSYAIALSVGLRHGIPLADLLRAGLGVSFVPNGRTDDPDIPRARSVVDYFSRRLAIDWLPHAECAALGVRTSSDLPHLGGRGAAQVPEQVLAPHHDGEGLVAVDAGGFAERGDDLAAWN